MAREADYDVDLFAEMVRTGEILREKGVESNGHGSIAEVEPDHDHPRRNKGEN